MRRIFIALVLAVVLALPLVAHAVPNVKSYQGLSA
jgi:hypothetical protein